MAFGVKTERIEIKAPNMQDVMFRIQGTSNMVWCAFSQKAQNAIHAIQEAGSTARSSNKKEKKDFQAEYEAAKHVSTEGWCGIPAPAFRDGIISACKMCGVVMTQAKLAITIKEDGLERVTGNPLVNITKGEPQYFEAYVRLPNGSFDLRARPRWSPGWEANVVVSYDADFVTLESVTNLMMRVGLQVGIGEGRNDSKKSCGQGWGFFKLLSEPKEEKPVKAGKKGVK